MNEPKPVSAPESAPAKSNTKAILLIGGCVLALCCVSTMCVVGFFLLNKPGQSPIVTLTNTPTPEVELPMYTPDVTEPISGAPNLNSVKTTYLSKDSYHFEGIVYTSGEETMSFLGEFKSPNNDHYVTTESDGYVTEEYTINGLHYIRENDGAWELSDSPFNSTIQRAMILDFLDNAPRGTQAVDDNGYWSFYFDDVVNDETTTLYINKQTNNVAELITEYKDDYGDTVREELIFTLYNDSDISLVAPVVGP